LYRKDRNQTTLNLVDEDTAPVEKKNPSIWVNISFDRRGKALSMCIRIGLAIPVGDRFAWSLYQLIIDAKTHAQSLHDSFINLFSAIYRCSIPLSSAPGGDASNSSSILSSM
jgi:hypothetical protein